MEDIFDPITIRLVKITSKMKSIEEMYTPCSAINSKECVDPKSETTIKMRVRCDSIGYIEKSKIEKFRRSHKVLVSNTITSNVLRNYHKKVLANKVFKSGPDEFCTLNFCCFYADSELEMESIYSYLRTGIICNLFAYGKTKRKRNCFTYVPIVPFDRVWDNKSVLEYILKHE